MSEKDQNSYFLSSDQGFSNETTWTPYFNLFWSLFFSLPDLYLSIYVSQDRQRSSSEEYLSEVTAHRDGHRIKELCAIDALPNASHASPLLLSIPLLLS